MKREEGQMKARLLVGIAIAMLGLVGTGCSVATKGASSVGGTSATLNALVTFNNATDRGQFAYQVVEVPHLTPWGPCSSSGCPASQWWTPAGGGPVNYGGSTATCVPTNEPDPTRFNLPLTVTGLAPNTTYAFRAIGTYCDASWRGDDPSVASWVSYDKNGNRNSADDPLAGLGPADCVEYDCFVTGSATCQPSTSYPCGSPISYCSSQNVFIWSASTAGCPPDPATFPPPDETASAPLENPNVDWFEPISYVSEGQATTSLVHAGKCGAAAGPPWVGPNSNIRFDGLIVCSGNVQGQYMRICLQKWTGPGYNWNTITGSCKSNNWPGPTSEWLHNAFPCRWSGVSHIWWTWFKAKAWNNSQVDVDEGHSASKLLHCK
jgi:hypothetical protein